VIRHKSCLTVLVFCGLLALISPVVSADSPSPLRFSPEKIRMEGVIGEDTFTATFYLLTSEQEVKSISLFATDLVSAKGDRISGTAYQVTPNSFATIPAYNGEMVTLTVTKIGAAGRYTGEISAMYDGAGPAPRPTLEVELLAREKPALTLAKDSSSVNIVATRPTFPFGRHLTSPAIIHVRQTGAAPAILREISQMGPAAAQGLQPAPKAALIVSPAAPLILMPGIWQPIAIAVDAAALHAGHYGATLVLTPQGADDLEVGVDIKLRDAWLWPLLCLLLGVSLSFVVAVYTSVGQGRLKALDTVDDIRKRLAAPEGLPADRLDEWRRALDRLEERARTEPPGDVQPALDGLAERINSGGTRYEEFRKQLTDWEQQVKGWTKAASADVRVLAASPWIAGLPARLKEIQARLSAGGFERGEIEAEIEAIGTEVTLAEALVKALPEALKSPALDDALKEEIREALAAPPAAMDDMQDVIELLEDRKLMQAPSAVVIGHYAAAEREGGEEEKKQPAPPLRRLGARLSRAWAWAVEPRHRWRLVGYLLGLLFLAGLLVAGMIALYVDNDTFGANRFLAYLGLVLWGLGADASRRKLQDLQGVTDYLRDRLGLNK